MWRRFCALPRAFARGAGAFRRDRREVHRRRRDGALRCAGCARGRPGACGTGSARDRGLGARRRTSPGADRREQRRSADQSRRSPRVGRRNGRRRRREHDGAHAVGGAGERRARRRDHVSRHGARGVLPCARPGRGERESWAALCLGGARAARTLRGRDDLHARTAGRPRTRVSSSTRSRVQGWSAHRSS